jgi:hypothetical protein
MFRGKTCDPRKPVLMSGAILFAGVAVNCLVPRYDHFGGDARCCRAHDIPERFDLFFRADAMHIPCHVVRRQEERIGQAF